MSSSTRRKAKHLRGELGLGTAGRNELMKLEEALAGGRMLLSSSKVSAALEAFGRAKHLSGELRLSAKTIEASLGLARCLLKVGDLESVKAECAEILNMHHGCDSGTVAQALMLVAQAEIEGGNPKDATKAGESAMAALAGSGDELAQAECERLLGIAAAEQGDLDAAEDYFHGYVVAQRRAGDAVGEARGLSNLAVVAKRRGQLRESLRYHKRVLKVMRSVGDKEREAVVLRNIGITLMRIGKLADARSSLEQSLSISEDGGFERSAVAARIGLGNVALLEGNIDAAEGLLDRAIDVSREKGYARAKALALEGLGDVCAAGKRASRADTLYRKAIAIASEHSVRNDVLPELYLKRAELSTESGDLRKAERMCRLASELASDVSDRLVLASVAKTTGKLAAKSGEPGRALELLMEAEKELIWMGARLELGKLFVERAELYEAGLLDRPGGAPVGEPATLDGMRARAIFCEMGSAPWIERLRQLRMKLGLVKDGTGPTEKPKGTRVIRPEPERIDREKDFPWIITVNPGMLNLLQRVRMVAGSTAPVLIVGESGVGKELIARAIHRISGRSGRIVALNTAALPRELYESELFGHARGAFSGADRERKGLVEEADGGTLFLDEIGDMPAELQVRLLRVLQDGEFRRVGESRTRHTSARIVSATHRDLKSLVEQGTFRNDLFYRLCTIILEVPPLRDRPDDIPRLYEHFVRLYEGLEGKEIAGVEPEVHEIFAKYEWRENNVRELENEIRRSVALCPHRGRISPELLSPRLTSNGGNGVDRNAGLAQKVHALERELICEALARFSGNKTHAAEFLGISRSGLNVKMRKLDIVEDPTKLI